MDPEIFKGGREGGGVTGSSEGQEITNTLYFSRKPTMRPRQQCTYIDHGLIPRHLVV